MNTKRYWLRGGLIMVALYVALVINAIPQNFAADADEFMLGLAFLQYPLSVVERLLNIPFYDIPTLIIGGLLVWFGIGAFLGWLYGKIKSRKSSVSNY